MRTHNWTRARARPRSHVPGRMNRTEAAYSEILEARRLAGEITGWMFESLRFRLADNTHFCPDFVVQMIDGTFEVHEVKACRSSGGFLIEDDASVKIKVAAEMYPWLGWQLCGQLPKKAGGGWKFRYFSRENAEE